MKIIKQLFCRHKFNFIRNIYGDEIQECGYMRSVWKCQKCGAVKEFPDLHKDK